MQHLTLPDGGSLPALGQGTWGMGEQPGRRESEVAALRHGLDRGLGLIDTAEMYGSGGAEEVVGEAVAARREQAFLVSKVLPSNASRSAVLRACERSLQRLGTEYLDLYLLHWRGSSPLAETLAAFGELREQGKIRRFGVSNFDPDDMAELVQHDLGDQVVTNQVLYNLTRRGVEFELLPWCAQQNLPVMAYSPIEQGRLLDSPALRAVAERRSAEPAQVALAWVLRADGVCAIPKAADPRHVDSNLAALDIELDAQDLAELDAEFPAPSGPTPLEIL